MRLIDLDDILKKFPKADFDGDDLENMKAYPHWKTDITGLFNILKSVPTIETCEDCISRQAVLDIINFEDEWLHDANSHNADTKIAFNGLESRVKELPSVPPKIESEE